MTKSINLKKVPDCSKSRLANTNTSVDENQIQKIESAINNFTIDDRDAEEFEPSVLVLVNGILTSRIFVKAENHRSTSRDP